MGDDPVCKIYQGDELIYPTHKDWSKEYFTIEALEDGDMVVRGYGNASNFKYSINNGPWAYAENYNTTTFSLREGDMLRLSSLHYVTFRDQTLACNVMGNWMSLLHGDNFINDTSIPNIWASIFRGCTGLVDASNLVLPTTNLITPSHRCYEHMFEGCSSLIVAPELPATTLDLGCYRNMFVGCSSLTTAPALPATELADACYSNMFQGCSSLTTPPQLPATALTVECYYYMFRGCTSLATAPALPATALAERCYAEMFYGCTSLTTAPDLPATTLAEKCYWFMFANCTSLTKAPDLPAPTLVDSCYLNMFRGSSQLNYIKCLATDISATYCTGYWVQGTAEVGTFYCAPGMENAWARGDDGVPTGWTITPYTE